MTTTGRTISLLALAGVLLAGCAVPGQLGSAAPLPAAQPAPSPGAPPAPAPVPPAGPALIGTGRVEAPVTIRTPGPAVMSVRTVVLQPGETTGWHRHPGTEMAAVESGAVTVLTGDECDGVRYRAGAALFVPDAEPHLERNDGTVPVELVVTYLLAPGAPDTEDVDPAC